jgi:hypothetical protein
MMGFFQRNAAIEMTQYPIDAEVLTKEHHSQFDFSTGGLCCIRST